MESAQVRGFTLIELMVVIAIIGVILGIALPAYQSQIRHSRRSEAMQTLAECALRQERYRADHPAYGTAAQLGAANLGCGTSTYYTITIVAAANTYTITADAVAPQDQDKQDGVSCAQLTIDQAKTKGSDPKCWK